ncbi:uncharacterized protein LOC131614049 [Vicia villosa]|uniref:uncharacterized protein LOC131614049 n=1 Tax=Vicia villosa TaxID=3911 RepID=UPI00273C3D59|nr:uncharacterized protein LOC131614049 [Vicia villosa]
MPNHDKIVNDVDDSSYVFTMSDLTTPLPIVKKKLLQGGLFPGCIENCYFCESQSNGCWKLKEGIHHLMENRTILFEKTPAVESLVEEVSVITNSKTPVRITSKGPVMISAEPIVAPLIITRPLPIPYSSNKAIPWNYGVDVYIYGVKPERLTDKTTKVTNPDVDSIVGTSKVTRSGRILFPEISPKTVTTLVRISTSEPSTETRDREPVIEHVQTKAPVETTIEDSSKKEMERMLKIIRKSDYNIVERLGHTSSKISMLSLLMCSEAHAKALMKFLKSAHVPQEISVNQFENCVASLIIDNGPGFSDTDLTPTGRNHNKGLHISIECRGTTLSDALVDNGSSLYVLLKVVLDKLDYEGIVLKRSDVVVRAFDGSKRMVHGEYPAKGEIVTICGEEEYMVSHLNNFKYVEMDGEFFETPCQTFEVVPQTVYIVEPVPYVPKVTRVPPTMDSLKDTRAVVEYGESNIGMGDLLGTEDEGEENCEVPGELARLLQQEEKTIQPHEEPVEVLNLGTNEDKKEIKIGAGLEGSVKKKLSQMLHDYAEIFAWSYEDMSGLDTDIVVHRLPMKEGCPSIK